MNKADITKDFNIDEEGIIDFNGKKHKKIILHNKYVPTKCCNCRSTNIRKKDKSSKYFWIIVDNKPVYVNEQMQRYYCRDCRTSFTTESHLSKGKTKNSDEFNKYLAETLISDIKGSIRSAAKIYNLSPAYCSIILHEYISKFDDSIISVKRYETLFFIPIEYGRQWRCFICGKNNHEGIKLLFILEDYSYESIEKFIKQKNIDVSLVKTVYCHLNRHLVERLQSLFSNSEICILRKSMFDETRKYELDRGYGLSPSGIKLHIYKMNSIIEAEIEPDEKDILLFWWEYMGKSAKPHFEDLWEVLLKNYDACVNTLCHTNDEEEYKELNELIIFHRKMKTDFSVF